MFVVSVPGCEVVRSIGREGRKPGCLNSPTDLALDRSGRLVVSDAGNDRIQVGTASLTMSGTGCVLQVLDSLGTHVCYIGVHDLVSPGGLALGPGGEALAVADTGNNRCCHRDT